jgi:hypothetical protein
VLGELPNERIRTEYHFDVFENRLSCNKRK